MPQSDESHYFDINYYENDLINIEVPKNKIIGESTSSYFRCKYVPERIYKNNPKSKIIVSLRNPIQRAYSHYWHERKKNKIKFEFEELFSNFDLFENWIESGFYVDHYRNYLKYFDKSQILVLKQEEILINKTKHYKILLD